MPGNGTISLAAFGSQDMYLTGNPQITFWKAVFKRYTNFAIESIAQPLNGNVDFGQRFSAVIARNGDLAYRCVLQVTVPSLTGSTTGKRVRWVDKLGHALIDWCELVIGGSVIDKQYGEWLEIYSQLTLPPNKLGGYNRMIGHTAAMLSCANPPAPHPNNPNSKAPSTTLYIPLQFYFCQAPGLALPLAALQYHDVRINFQLRPLENLIIKELSTDQFTGSIVDAALYVDYIFLDTEEKRRFVSGRHEYIVTQLQQHDSEPVQGPADLQGNITCSVQLNFNHPCKYLVWLAQKSEFVNSTNNQTFNYTTVLQDRTGTNFSSAMEDNNTAVQGPLISNTLILNGRTRYDERPGDYFNHVQSFFHLPNTPSSPGIYVYSFALDPADPQPSGSTNFSRIDSAILQSKYSSDFLIDSTNLPSPALTRVYAQNINIMKIMSGLAGIAYCA